MTRSTKLTVASIFVTVAVAVAGVVIWRNYIYKPPMTLSAMAAPGVASTVAQSRGAAPPVMFQAPPFKAFTDQQGKPTGDEQLHGRVWIGDFIFTHCAGSCPAVTAKFVELQKSLVDPDIRFVSFSVDPERDDPKTLKAYSDEHNAGDARWMLLRPPDRKAVFNVAQRMAAIAKSTDAHDSILHTDFFILIDPQGKVRGLYDSKNAAQVERLKEDARVLVRQRAADQAKSQAPEKPKTASAG